MASPSASLARPRPRGLALCLSRSPSPSPSFSCSRSPSLSASLAVARRRCLSPSLSASFALARPPTLAAFLSLSLALTASLLLSLALALALAPTLARPVDFAFLLTALASDSGLRFTPQASRFASFQPSCPGKGGGGGKTRWERGKVKEKDHAGGEGSPSIKLGLGIGASGVTKQQGKCGFTLAQWYEFQQQAIICKYIVSGLVVPFYLVLPIWKSVARCFGSANGGIYNHFPSFIGFNLQDFHCKGEMDPEPGRCRRTDGKKWRCSRDVVPNQKYCERHMHRGCQRSRKHVTASVIASQPGTSIDACKATKTSNSGDITSTKSNLSISSPVDFELATPSSNTGTNSSATASPTTNSVSDFSRNGVLSPSAENNRNNNVHVDVKDASYGHLDNRSNINRSSKGVKSSGDGNFAGPGFGSSTNGAQQGLGRGSSSWVDNGHGEGTGFRRCRRTDGKKWQCSREVLPDEKYCERHVNRGRGAKKFVVHYQQPIPIRSVSLAPPPLAIPKTAVIPSTADTRMNVDIGLSIAVAASPAPITSDESSDATTITDEIGTFSHLVAASP